jgi:excisionase family DNA binding protein
MSALPTPLDDDASTVLTVEEAADVLRIGRSLAYQLANQYLSSRGMIGMPAYRLGNCIRVPRWALMVLATTGRVVRLNEAKVSKLGEPNAA